jgi:hypothetical protein
MCRLLDMESQELTTVGFIRLCGYTPCHQILDICQAEWYTRDQDCSWRLRHSSVHGRLDLGDQVCRSGTFAPPRIYHNAHTS